ncbi:uncharacterized protein LOC131155361 isoform X1 [Malania oleifera]|uniref:uncharacterized protein LOC131155361 isoform X1 n=1 Tax=Malania oleifera TaxID=397392 RepID=UPI0025AE39D0|nr:uncharacterized protein LOC131155361 isoform X1 [Malania oleifera]
MVQDFETPLSSLNFPQAQTSSGRSNTDYVRMISTVQESSKKPQVGITMDILRGWNHQPNEKLRNRTLPLVNIWDFFASSFVLNNQYGSDCGKKLKKDDRTLANHNRRSHTNRGGSRGKGTFCELSRKGSKIRETAKKDRNNFRGGGRSGGEGGDGGEGREEGQFRDCGGGRGGGQCGSGGGGRGGEGRGGGVGVGCGDGGEGRGHGGDDCGRGRGGGSNGGRGGGGGGSGFGSEEYVDEDDFENNRQRKSQFSKDRLVGWQKRRWKKKNQWWLWQ